MKNQISVSLQFEMFIMSIILSENYFPQGFLDEMRVLHGYVVELS